MPLPPLTLTAEVEEEFMELREKERSRKEGVGDMTSEEDSGERVDTEEAWSMVADQEENEKMVKS